VIRHVLAPHVPAAAAALDVPLSLPLPGVALTFDDGPHPEGTPAVLEILADADAKAMFFLVGEQVERRPELAAEIAARGHEVAVHGFRHRLQLRRSGSALASDVESAVSVIEDAARSRPRWHRPPYGVYSAAGLRAARQVGLKPLLWSRWGKDWRGLTTPARIAKRVIRGGLLSGGGLSAGDVILLHDADFYSARQSYRHTVEALPGILEELRSRKLATVLPI
jgi:peptidoglycan/xylan/chitin deacetylase (PgdA/CDA1 family)